MKLSFHLLQKIPKPVRKGNVKFFMMQVFTPQNSHLLRRISAHSLGDKSTCFTFTNR